MSGLQVRGLPVTEPGFYRMTAEEYHADPSPEPSLSASMARLMLAAPQKAWTAHPRLNPDFEPDEGNKVLDFGTAAHSLLIGEGKDIVIVDADSWRTKAAKAERDEAIENGKVAILKAEYERAQNMAKVATVQLAAIPDCDSAFRDGHGEIAAIWQEGETWCRSLIDWIEPRDDRFVITDLKTTQASAAPGPGTRHLYDRGYNLQAAFHSRGVIALTGRPCEFRFVLQEKEPPHLLTVFVMDGAGLTIGDKQMTFALDLWRRCVETGVWPGYPAQIVTAEMPPWAETAWLNREVADEALGDSHEALNESAHDLAKLLRAG